MAIIFFIILVIYLVAVSKGIDNNKYIRDDYECIYNKDTHTFTMVSKKPKAINEHKFTSPYMCKSTIPYTYNKKTNTVTFSEKPKYVSKYDLSQYTTNNTIMTPTEQDFYEELKYVTDKLNMTIFSQVNMERLIKVKDGNWGDRGRIKSRSIDYVIVNNRTNKVVCCIELDDYTHNYRSVKETDDFRNELFKKVGIPLHRIKVSRYYCAEDISHMISGDMIKEVC